MTPQYCYQLGKGAGPLHLVLNQSLDVGQSGCLQMYPCRGLTTVDFLQAALPETEGISLSFLNRDLGSISQHPLQSRYVYLDQWDLENNYHLFPLALNLFWDFIKLFILLYHNKHLIELILFLYLSVFSESLSRTKKIYTLLYSQYLPQCPVERKCLIFIGWKNKLKYITVCMILLND